MKRNIYSILNFQFSILLCVLVLSSCRPQGDELLSYGQNDSQAFYEAERSFAGEFKAFWTAMNENYGIWDFEESFGTNWDEVYALYLPKFEELDNRQGKKVTDAELKALYLELTDTLHDGHMTLSIKNLHTGKYISVSPNENRVVRERGTEMQDVINNPTDLHTYLTPAAGTYAIKEYDGTNSTNIIVELIDSTLNRAVRKADEYIAAVDAAGGPNSTNDKLYALAADMKKDANQLLNTIHNYPRSQITYLKAFLYLNYNNFCEKYESTGKLIGANIVPVETEMISDQLGMLDYALFDGNIAYLRIGGFALTLYLYPEYQTHDTTTMAYAYQESVKRVWKKWFDAIQVHHKAGDLGGIIIDVRNNGGGIVNDYQYVVGALLPSGGWASHTLRMKNGIGRLDYGPLTPFYVMTYENEHEVINDRPIVALANCVTISMAENTVWGVQSQPNGCFIGTRTYGGLSALHPDPQYYNENYSGAFGVKNVTPIYGYIPKYVCLFGEEQKIRESIGFIPDIECPLDVNLWQTQGRDNQLEKAVDYIRTK